MFLSHHHPKYHLVAFKYALRGIADATTHGRAFQLEIFLTLVAFGLGIYLNLDLVHFLIITVLMLGLMVVEMVNTAIEAAVDSVHSEHNELARLSKDSAAGAVLLMAVVTALVWIYLFLPPLIEKLLNVS